MKNPYAPGVSPPPLWLPPTCDNPRKGNTALSRLAQGLQWNEVKLERGRGGKGRKVFTVLFYHEPMQDLG